MMLFAQITDSGGDATLLALVRAHWPIVLTAALGGAGIYLLLPGGRRRLPIVGGLLAALAVVAAGQWLIQLDVAGPERLLFAAFSLLAVGGGVLLLSQTNPVHAALSFALVVLSTCGLFLLLAAPFLMAATIIIYAGAIVVTFLFVIMLAQQAGLASADARSREPFLASLAGFVLLGAFWIVLDRTYDATPLEREIDAVARAESWETVASLWGEPGKPPAEKTLPVVDRLRERFPEDLVLNLENAWSRRDLDELRKRAARLQEHAHAHRHERGKVLPADQAIAEPGRLKAGNVAGLGRTLFSYYLVPVEMAGMLLLVATIGAIVIAGRRREELR
jgi:NADH-quinone oxidoreductase subunit J